MAYKFTFDLSKIPTSFFAELAMIASESKFRRIVASKTRNLANKLTEITGLEMPQTLELVQDLIDVYSQNVSEKERFDVTKKRALLLPHCSRKYMDSRCKATFDPEVPTYFCNHCSEDCHISKATELGIRKGYDVFVLPGGSCVANILKSHRHDGIAGVACGQEARLVMGGLKNMGYAGQAIPLTKNGCACTTFNIDALEKTL